MVMAEMFKYEGELLVVHSGAVVEEGAAIPAQNFAHGGCSGVVFG